MQKYIHLNIDEIYVKPSARFTGGQIYGYANDEPSQLARTILVILAISHHGRPNFVVSMTPVYRLDANFQRQIVLEAIKNI